MNRKVKLITNFRRIYLAFLEKVIAKLCIESKRISKIFDPTKGAYTQFGIYLWQSDVFKEIAIYSFVVG